MRVHFASSAASVIRAHAAADHPLEACGLLLGTPGTVREAHPAANVAADPHRRFEIDPAHLLRLHREARGRGLAVLGHYHSHPDGRLQPSRRDAARASEDGQLWVIAAAGQLAAFRAIAEGAGPARFEAVEMDIG